MGIIVSSSASSIADGAVTTAKLAASAVTQAKLDYTTIKGLELVESKTLSAVSGTDAIRFTGLSHTTYAYYVLFWDWYGSTTQNQYLRLNQDATAGNYEAINFADTTLSKDTTTSVAIGECDSSKRSSGFLIVNTAGSGKSNSFGFAYSGYHSGNVRAAIGATKLTGVNITSIDISTFAAGTHTLTGTCTLYGVRA